MNNTMNFATPITSSKKQDATRIMFFGYEDSLNIDLMKRICPDGICLGVATLKDHALICDAHGLLTIEPEEGMETQGLLWALTPKDEQYMKSRELLFEKGCGRVSRKQVVLESTHQTVPAIVYESTLKPFSFKASSPEHMKYLAQLARELDLNSDTQDAFMEIISSTLVDMRYAGAPIPEGFEEEMEFLSGFEFKVEMGKCPYDQMMASPDYDNEGPAPARYCMMDDMPDFPVGPACECDACNAERQGFGPHGGMGAGCFFRH